MSASAVRSLLDCRSLCPGVGSTGPGSSQLSRCTLLDAVPDASLPDAAPATLDAFEGDAWTRTEDGWVPSEDAPDVWALDAWGLDEDAWTLGEDAWMVRDDSGVADAGLVVADGGPPDPYAEVLVRIRCDYEICRNAGRLPSYASPFSARRSDVGTWLARTAALEAAAIPAFAELRRELRAHGAPSRLVESTWRAQRDEVRHARMLGRLARAAGARPRGFRPRPTEPRDLESLATLNATEGCVREVHGALVAHAQGLHASDPVVRRVFAEIARDEARHALVSLAVDAWVRPRLREAQRRRVQAAREAAHASLVLGSPEAAEVREPLGLPGDEANHALARLCA